MANQRSFWIALSAVLLIAAFVRVGYVVAQPAVDPHFDLPVLEAGEYWDESSAILEGRPSDEDAYYRGPLYVWLLAAIRFVSSDSFGTVYLLQHLAILISAVFLALSAKRLAGRIAGIATAALWLGYHPTVFFASAVASEPFALLLLSIALWVTLREWSAWGGVATGLLSLIRPNLVLLPVGWTVWLFATRRRKAGVVLLLAAVAVILPVTIRNAVRSGHFVPISSNAGMTLFQGLAATEGYGFGVIVPEFSGSPSEQREAARSLAMKHSKRELDHVEADNYLRNWAFEKAFADPLRTLKVFAGRLKVLFSSREFGIDVVPDLDENPWQLGTPVWFGVFLGLGVVAALTRWGGANMSVVWIAMLTVLVTPVVFQATSRYRLPLVALLAVAAGVGLAAIVNGPRSPKRMVALFLAFLVASMGSLLVVRDDPSFRYQTVLGYVGMASAWNQKGQVDRAWRELEKAKAFSETENPEVPGYWFMFGLLHDQADRLEVAEEAYWKAWDPEFPSDTIGRRLAWVLTRTGSTQKAIDVLKQVIRVHPWDDDAWTNLIVVYVMNQDIEGARRAIAEARALEVKLDPALLDDVEALAPVGEGEKGE